MLPRIFRFLKPREPKPLNPRDLIITGVIFAQAAVVSVLLQEWYTPLTKNGSVSVLPFVAVFLISMFALIMCNALIMVKIHQYRRQHSKKPVTNSSAPRDWELVGNNVEFIGTFPSKPIPAPDGRLSEVELDCLRQLIGKQFVSVCSPVIQVREQAIEAMHPSLRLDNEEGFIILEARDVESELSRKGFYHVHSRLGVSFSKTPAAVPYARTKNNKAIVGPCSFVEFDRSFVVQCIEVFANEHTVHDRTDDTFETVNLDLQLTFRASSGAMLSVWAGGPEVWLSRDGGLLNNPALNLTRRLIIGSEKT